METFPLQAKLYRYRYLLLMPLLAALFSFIAIKIIDPVEYANNDFFTFWLAGRLTLSGQNPYLADIWIGGHHQFGATWIPNRTFIYPLPIALFFAPLGALPLYQAFVTWDILSQFMLVLAVVLLLTSYPAELKKRFLLPLLVGIVLFRPTILTLHNGQMSALLLVILALIVFFWEKGEWWKGSVFLPILVFKPNLGVPIVLMLSIYLLLQKQFTALIAEGISGLALILVGLLQNLHWISDFWRAGNNKLSEMFGFSPTVWGISAFFCRYERSCTLLYGSISGLILLAAFVFLVTRKRPGLSPTLLVSLVTTVVLLVTPYTWPYDQLLLLLPIVTITMALAGAGYRFLPTALLPLIFDTLAFVLLGISISLEREYWNVMIPLSVFFLLIWYLSMAKPAPSPAKTARSIPG